MVDKVQIGFPLDADINDKINKLAPRGLKAEAIRSLLNLLLATQLERTQAGKNDFVVDHLLRGRCRLVVVDRD
jgi:hypothetical protein